MVNIFSTPRRRSLADIGPSRCTRSSSIRVAALMSSMSFGIRRLNIHTAIAVSTMTNGMAAAIQLKKPILVSG